VQQRTRSFRQAEKIVTMRPNSGGHPGNPTSNLDRCAMEKSTPVVRLTVIISGAMILIGLLLIVSSNLPQFDKDSWPQRSFIEIGIALLSAGTVGFAYDSLVRGDFLAQIKDQLITIIDADARRLGITEIYGDRSDKIRRMQLHELIEKAKSEIIFVGLGLNITMTQYERHLEAAIARNVKIRMLIFDLESQNAMVLEHSLGTGYLINDLKSAFDAVLRFAAKYPNAVELRKFHIVPPFGAIAIDRDQHDGFLIVELYCYNSLGFECPGMRLEKKAGGLFSAYDRQITDLLTHFKPASNSLAVTNP
jgi:Domain of unknown function (DUF5919)